MALSSMYFSSPNSSGSGCGGGELSSTDVDSSAEDLNIEDESGDNLTEQVSPLFLQKVPSSLGMAFRLRCAQFGSGSWAVMSFDRITLRHSALASV